MGEQGKLRIVPNGHAAYCPGCMEYHIIYSSWSFDGNFDSPTFSPSLLVTKGDGTQVCHAFIRDGQWRFLLDCTHDLKGQTVALRDEVNRESEVCDF